MATGRALGLLLLASVLLGSWGFLAKPGTWRPRHVVLVSLDTCRADHLGGMGYRRPTTPNLDRLAREGVLFRRAFSQANESLYSYSSLFTGRYARHLAPLEREFTLPEGAVPLAAVLQGAGFRTGAFVGGAHLRARFGFSRGFEVYRDEWDFGSFFQTVRPALDWLEGVAEDGRAPSFLFVQGYDLHAPYAKPLGFSNLYDPDYRGRARELVTDLLGVELVYRSRLYSPRSGTTGDLLRELPDLERRGAPSEALSPADVDHVVAAYDGALSYADVWMGLLRARLRELGLEDETLLVVMGDHGEDLRRQDYLAHRVLLLDSSVHVPLILWGRGLPAGRTVDRVVELRDLRSTLLALLDLGPRDAGLARDLGEKAPGGGGQALSEGVQPRWSLREDRYRLVCDARTDEPDEVLALELEAPTFALYDLETDPGETANLLADPARAAGARREAARLRADWASRWRGDAAP